jgi:hypothetical protein
MLCDGAEHLKTPVGHIPSTLGEKSIEA